MAEQIFINPLCGNEPKIYEAVGIDGHTNESRRKAHDNKKCARCNRNLDNSPGWKIPEFHSYIDVSYVCPECRLIQESINQRIKEIDLERIQLESEKKDEISGIEICDGDYQCIWGDYFSLKMFLDDIEFYKKNENEIRDIRKHNNDINNKITELVGEGKVLYRKYWEAKEDK